MTSYADRAHLPAARKRAIPASRPQPPRVGSKRGAIWHAIQLKAAQSATAAAKTPIRSGLPTGLKTGIEQLSGMAMDDVRVHRNSPEPARLGALAYTQGNDIRLGPGQERHLPHEAWHVVQQKQGRVKATTQMKGAEINDSPALEAEADAMGAKALTRGAAPVSADTRAEVRANPGDATPLQFRLLTFRPETTNYQGGVATLHGMAQELEKQTQAAYTIIADELAGYVTKKAEFSFEKYGSSTKERIAYYYTCLCKDNDSLKAAAAGYMIEDIVTKKVGGTKGYTSQYAVSGARPDFLIEADDLQTGRKARGVVDITSEKQAGHILDKDFSTASYDYAAECLYPNLNFLTGTKVALDPNSVLTARQVQMNRANEYVMSRLNNIWTNASLYDNFLFYGIFGLKDEIGIIKKGVRSVADKREISPQAFKDVDAIIGKVNSRAYTNLETVEHVVGAAQAKYGLKGYPLSWTAPSQTSSSTSSSMISFSSTNNSSAMPVVTTTSSSSSPAPAKPQVSTSSSQQPAPSSSRSYSSSSSYPVPSSISPSTIMSFPPMTLFSPPPTSSPASAKPAPKPIDTPSTTPTVLPPVKMEIGMD